LAQAKAQLSNAEAVQGRTELDVKRYTPLAKEQAAPQQDLDNAVQNNLAAIASVETAKAQIKTSQAAVETARINLEFTRLVAPIDGIVDKAQLQVGALVGPTAGPVTSVSTVDPIKVYFTVGEPQYLAFRKRFPTEASTRADQKTLRIELVLADGSTYPHLGSFDFADRQVNESTGTIRIAALFPNPNNILRRHSGLRSTNGRQDLNDKAMGRKWQRAIGPDRAILDGCPDDGRGASDICDLMPRSEDH